MRMLDRGMLRARDRGEQKVTPLELFFDLVYVYAITQLSHLLLGHPTVRGALETLFLLLVVWWAWQYTTWSTNWFGRTGTRHASARPTSVAAASVLPPPRPPCRGIRF